MPVDVATLAESWQLDDLQVMRLLELEEVWPEQLAQMVAEGSLLEYLTSWGHSVQELLWALMDPEEPGGAWQALGLTEGLSEADPARLHRLASEVPFMAREMAIREMVLAPLVTA